MQENYIEAKIIDNEVAPQLKLAERVKKLVREGGEKKYYIQTFGCQQNEADSERLAGYCTMMGILPGRQAGGRKADTRKHLCSP